MVTKEEIKASTKIGDVYDGYYGNGQRRYWLGWDSKPTDEPVVDTVVRMSEHSVWLQDNHGTTSHTAWNQFAKHVTKGIYRKRGE